eukprot:1902294-Prymnesium_polylepis.2
MQQSRRSAQTLTTPSAVARAIRSWSSAVRCTGSSNTACSVAFSFSAPCRMGQRSSLHSGQMSSRSATSSVGGGADGATGTGAGATAGREEYSRQSAEQRSICCASIRSISRSLPAALPHGFACRTARLTLHVPAAFTANVWPMADVVAKGGIGPLRAPC